MRMRAEFKKGRIHWVALLVAAWLSVAHAPSLQGDEHEFDQKVHLLFTKIGNRSPNFPDLKESDHPLIVVHANTRFFRKGDFTRCADETDRLVADFKKEKRPVVYLVNPDIPNSTWYTKDLMPTKASSSGNGGIVISDACANVTMAGGLFDWCQRRTVHCWVDAYFREESQTKPLTINVPLGATYARDLGRMSEEKGKDVFSLQEMLENDKKALTDYLITVYGDDKKRFESVAKKLWNSNPDHHWHLDPPLFGKGHEELIAGALRLPLRRVEIFLDGKLIHSYGTGKQIVKLKFTSKDAR